MTIALIDGKAAPMNEASGEALLQVVNAIQELSKVDGRSALGALTTLLEGNTLDATAKAAAIALRKLAQERGARWVEDLLSTVGDIERRKEAEDRRLGWGPKDWTVDSDALSPATLSVAAKGGVFAEFTKEGAPPALPSHVEAEAASQIRIIGDLAFSVGAKADLSVGAIEGGVTFGGKRSYTAHYTLTSESVLAGRALASQITLLRLPTDYDGLVNAFTSDKVAQLQGVVVEGDASIGANADVRAAFPTQYGTFGLMLGGSLQASRGFTYTITEADGGGLAIAASSGSAFTNKFEIGASYRVGLSTIAPGVAAVLLEKTQEYATAFKTIDEKTKTILQKAETWLKPGTLVKGKIEDNLKAALAPAKYPGPDGEVARAAARALAGVFGFSNAFGADTDAAIAKVSEAGAGLIAELVDDTLGVVLGDSDKIAGQIQKSLAGALNEKAQELLASEVFRKIVPDVNTVLGDLEREIDDAVKRQINQLLGIDGKAGLEEIGEYLEDARELVSKILDGVAKAQTELLAAEIGWHRERAKEAGFEYKAVFDGSHEAKAAYKDVVLAPRRFGDLFDDAVRPSGVEILDAGVSTRLFKKTGPRWSVALVGLGVGGAVTKKSDIVIETTQDGVSITAGGDIVRMRRVLKEARSFSFLSAMGLFEAKTRGETLKADEIVGGDPARVRVFGPRAAASIKLNFEEEDNKLHLKEAKKLLKRFVESRLVSDDVRDNLVEAIKSAHREAGEDHVPGALSIALAVPTSKVISVLEFVMPTSSEGFEAAGGTDHSGFVIEATKRALARYDTDRVDQAERDIALLATLGVLPQSMAPPPAAVEFESATSGFVRRRSILESVESAAAALPIGALSESIGLESSSAALAEADEAVERIRNLGDAQRALIDVLQMGADIYFNMEIPAELHDPSKEREHREFAKKLEDRQRDMISAAGKFLKPRLPTGGVLPFMGKAPKSAVALFAALQEVTRAATPERIAPPLIVTFKPEKGSPTALVSPVAPALR